VRGLLIERNSLQRPIVQQQQRERQSDEHGLGHEPGKKQSGRQQVAPPVRPLGIPGVGKDRKQEKKCAENIFSLCDPGDRLDVERMQGEQGCGEQAGSGALCDPLQKQKEQYRVQRMDEYIVEVMAGRIQGKQLVIERVREPRKRMPVRSLGGGERPLDGGPAQAVMNVRVGGNVFAIVQDEKRMPGRGDIQRDGGGGKNGAESGIPSVGRKEGRGRLQLFCILPGGALGASL